MSGLPPELADTLAEAEVLRGQVREQLKAVDLRIAGRADENKRMGGGDGITDDLIQAQMRLRSALYEVEKCESGLRQAALPGWLAGR